MLYCICTKLFSALRAGREVKSFVPEAIVPNEKGMIAWKKFYRMMYKAKS